MNSIVSRLIRSVIERRASGSSLDDLRKGLEASGEQIATRIASAADTPENRAQAGHVIGIERWGTQRLRGVLTPGVPPALDEYDGYRPSADLSMSALAAEFRSTRAETLALAENLGELLDCRTPHNDLGPLNVRGWLVYLSTHAGSESKKIK